MLSPLDDPDSLALLDLLAGLTSGNAPDFGQARQLYKSDPRLRVGNEMQSYIDGGMQTVILSAELFHLAR